MVMDERRTNEEQYSIFSIQRSFGQLPIEQHDVEPQGVEVDGRDSMIHATSQQDGWITEHRAPPDVLSLHLRTGTKNDKANKNNSRLNNEILL